MSLKTLSGDLIFYSLLDLAQRSVSLILVPLYTQVLSQQDYGRLDILQIVLSILVVSVDLQFVAAFSRLYFDYRRNEEGRQFAGTLVAVRLIAGTALAAGVILAGRAGFLDTTYFPAFSSHTTAWTIIALTVPASLTYDILLLQARMLRRKRAFAGGALTNLLISCGSSVVLVAFMGFGIVGVLVGLLVGRLVGILLLAIGLRDEIALSIHLSVLKPVFSYAGPLIPGWWLAFSSAYIGRFFVYGTRGAEENALLALSMKVAGLIGLFSVSFRSAWQPLAMAYIGESAGEQFYVRSLRVFMAGSFAAAVLIGASLGYVLPILTPDAYGVVELYFPIFAVGILLGECESNLQIGNQIAKRTMWISASAFVYLALNVAVLVALTSRLGVIAAGIGLIVAALGKVTLTYVTGQAHWRIAYDARAFVLFGAGCIVFILLGLGLGLAFVPPWAIRVGMLVVAFVVPWAMLPDSERRALATMVRGAVSPRLHA